MGSAAAARIGWPLRESPSRNRSGTPEKSRHGDDDVIVAIVHYHVDIWATEEVPNG
jgi:hypothetical protein